ncbi:ATP-dependent Clp protease proteolytic subunit [Candidatus Aerophobetes bacterium]|nr:ATP-dependent Clp protease proteolytic subunit [Candidatus Aerophobetes bacterium]
MIKKIVIGLVIFLPLMCASFSFAQIPEIVPDDWVSISGNIDRAKAEEVILALINLDSKPETAPIGIRISSPGGSLMPVMAICDVIRNLRRPVITLALGEAFSGAAIILTAGDKRFIGEHTMVMLHQPAIIFDRWSSSFEDLREFASVLTKIEDQMYNLLAKNTGKSIEEIKQMLKKEVWFTATEAIDFGLADEILSQEVLRIKIKEEPATPPPIEEEGEDECESPPPTQSYQNVEISS